MTTKMIFAVVSCLFFCACSKKDVYPPPVSFEVTINDSAHISTTEAFYEIYSSHTGILLALKDGDTLIKFSPYSLNGEVYLGHGAFQWHWQGAVYSPSPSSAGVMQLSDSMSYKSGTLTASGVLYRGSGPATSTIQATFRNIPKAISYTVDHSVSR